MSFLKPLPRRRRTSLACAVLVASSVAGCGDQTAESLSISETNGPGVGLVSASGPDKSGLQSDPSIAFRGTTGQSEDEVSGPVDAATDLDAPLADDAQFFAPPMVETPTKQVMQSDRGHEPVRLLGFVGGDSDKADARKAILKVGEKMITIGEGESVEGIELVDIQGRTITMQRDRDRWTLALFDQPLVNQSQQRKMPSTRRRSTQSSSVSRPNPRPTSYDAPNNSTPGIPAVVEPIIDLPEPPAPPDLTDLPGMDNIPGI